MKMKTAFNTVLLAAGLIVSGTGFGQSAPNSKPLTTMSQNPSAPVYMMQNPELATYTELDSSVALTYEYIDKDKNQQKLSIFTPARADLQKFNVPDYNAIIAPVAFVNFEGRGAYGRGEYAAFTVEKSQRHKLDSKLLGNPDAVKAFLEEKGNIVEVDRNINDLHLKQLFEANKGNQPSTAKGSSISLAVVGGG